MIERDRKRLLIFSPDPNLGQVDVLELDGLFTSFVNTALPEEHTMEWELLKIYQSAIRFALDRNTESFEATDAAEPCLHKDLQSLFSDAIQIVSDVERQEIRNQRVAAIVSMRVLIAFAPELVGCDYRKMLMILHEQTECTLRHDLVNSFLQEQNKSREYVQRAIGDLEPAEIVTSKQCASQRMKLALRTSLTRAACFLDDHAYMSKIIDALSKNLCFGFTDIEYNRI